MADKQVSARVVREFLRSETSGVLSTQSRVLEGYPFGSVVPYCLGVDGFPIILISHVAQHTRNIAKNSKVSLTVSQSFVDDVQTGARLTWVGDAEKTDDDGSISRYYRFFPESRGYHKTHDFAFYRIVPVRTRYIGGFGDIHWLNNELMTESTVIPGENECEIITQINADNFSFLQAYLTQLNIFQSEKDILKLVGIDTSGASLRVGNKIIRVAFGKMAKTANEQWCCLVKAIGE